MLGSKLPERIYLDPRSGGRVSAHQHVTLRTERQEPVEALIEDLSLSGFGMSTVANLGIGSIVGLDIHGALQRRVRIVRRTGLAYGCEFLTPLSEHEVNATLVAANAADTNPWAGPRPEISRAMTNSLSYFAKLCVVVGLLGILWAALIYCALLLS